MSSAFLVSSCWSSSLSCFRLLMVSTISWLRLISACSSERRRSISPGAGPAAAHTHKHSSTPRINGAPVSLERAGDHDRGGV